MREGSPELPKYRHSTQRRQLLVLLPLLTSRLPLSGAAPEALSSGRVVPCGFSIADKVRRHIAVAVNCHRRDPEASQYRSATVRETSWLSPGMAAAGHPWPHARVPQSNA
jgi:hypothetical protein